MNYRLIAYLIVILFLFVLLCPNVKAQQTIIIVPSADVLKKGQIYPRVTYRFRPFEPDQYEIVTPSIIYGLSNTQEVYANVSGINFVNTPNHILGAPPIIGVSPVLGLSYKKIIPITDTTRFTIGNRMDISLTKSITPGNFSFAHFSQQLFRKSTRITAGMYTQSGEHFFPNRTGALLGFEQYLIPNKLQLDVDWISRNEKFSFLAVGFKAKPKPHIIIETAVLIPNGSNTKFGFLVFIGKVLR